MSTITTWQPGAVVAAADLSDGIIQAIRDALWPQQVAALTAWAEARSRLEPHVGWVKNPTDAMHDVLEVIVNRTKDGRPRWQHLDVKGVCLEPYAFSCWLPHAGGDTDHDPRHLADNFEALMDRAQRLLAGETPSETLGACLAMAEVVTDRGVLSPLLKGATHYYANWIAPPDWSEPPAELVLQRYGHKYYKHVP